MQSDTGWVGLAAGAAVVWVNSLDYVFLGNITQLIALVYLVVGILLKAESRLFGVKVVKKQDYADFEAWKAEKEREK